MAESTKSVGNKRKFQKLNTAQNAGKNTKPKENTENGVKPVNKRIVFDEDGEEAVATKTTVKHNNTKNSKQQASEIGLKWYEECAEFNTNEEPLDIKETDIAELTSICKASFESELTAFQKRNPSDGKWLKTALHKGTSRDRANAGALLVQSNPIGNLEALETLIGSTKNANKTSTDSVDIVTELFINALLPPSRKLLPLPLRAADWKALKKSETDKSAKDKVYAFWHFESELKEKYFEFLRNVQVAIQGSQDANKNQAIICCSKLLNYAPEKEQMLLSMLVNKLGDPSSKVASKALHHLTEVSYNHPAMCGVITNETEKFLFRNNINEHAQHFALCFLAQLAPHGNVEVCAKLVQICFSFFKILVSKGAVNSRSMQAILRCLKRAIGDVVAENQLKPGADGGFMSKDTQDTIYRLVHFADIPTALQTLALLLQIASVVKSENQHERFYNTFYRKLLDSNLGTCSIKLGALFFHIFHRAVYIDANKNRAQAFIKRLLQVSLFFPTQMLCGSLIVINKILKARPELNEFTFVVKPEFEDDNENDDGEEHYNDALEEDNAEGQKIKVDSKPTPSPAASSSWHHAANKTTGGKVNVLQATKYNPLHRTPAYAGAEFALHTELIALLSHFHPSVRVFAQNLINNHHIKFYGDPLRDFSITQFLERFTFKNPKKLDNKKTSSLVQAIHSKQYAPHGSRGQSVKQLTESNCTEDERYIFAYLNKKKEIREAYGADDDEDRMDVDDDEFEAYLDGLAGKKKKKKKGDDDDDDEDVDEDLDFLADLEGEQGKPTKKAKRKSNDDEDDWGSDGSDANEDGDENDDDDNDLDGSDDEFGDSDDGSVSLEGDDDSDDLFENDSDPELDDDESDDGEPKAKKVKAISSKEFQRKLKNTDNMDSLFAAVDDFSEMLEETGKSKKHGTLGEIFNQDKSSEKQMEWEQKRLKQKFGGSKKTFKKKPMKRNRSQGKKSRGEAGSHKTNGQSFKKGKKK